ncbi:MAG: hypothetical protein PHU08_06180, partial [Dehalococcoidales bacterium]|nr:hypothetical protein [Dehalococcoidales bacterium]
MFYKSQVSNSETNNQVSAQVSLTPAESKRLIAKAVARLPEVKKALSKGMVIIGRGTTNSFVAEEIMSISIGSRADEYCRGIIAEGELRVTTKRAAERTIGNDFILRQGKVDSATQPQDAIKEFGGDDVFIKGANAVDSSGEAGVLAAGTEAGTIGWALPTLMSRGAHLIVPAGLEKLIPSVAEASRKCSVLRFRYSTGLPCALIPLVNGQIITEVQAFAVLAGVTAIHVASGGIGGSEGTVVLVLEGPEAKVS